MRELTEHEAEKVAGGDGIKLPGGNYISTTRVVFDRLGALGALTLSYQAGSVVGAGINYGYERATGGSLAHDAGGYFYENS